MRGFLHLSTNHYVNLISIAFSFVGPNNLWPWPIYSLGPKARAEEGYSPGSVIQVQNSLGTQPRTIQFSECPRSH